MRNRPRSKPNFRTFAFLLSSSAYSARRCKSFLRSTSTWLSLPLPHRARSDIGVDGLALFAANAAAAKRRAASHLALDLARRPMAATYPPPACRPGLISSLALEKVDPLAPTGSPATERGDDRYPDCDDSAPPEGRLRFIPFGLAVLLPGAEWAPLPTTPLPHTARFSRPCQAPASPDSRAGSKSSPPVADPAAAWRRGLDWPDWGLWWWSLPLAIRGGSPRSVLDPDASSEEAGVILAVPRVLRETAECSSTVAASVTGVSRSHGNSAASAAGAASSPWRGPASALAPPAAAEAGGMAVIFASSPHPGALSLETQGASRFLLSLCPPASDLVVVRGAVGGLSRAFPGNNSLVGVPCDAACLGWGFGTGVIASTDGTALSASPRSCEAEDGGGFSNVAAASATATARLVFSACTGSFAFRDGDRWYATATDVGAGGAATGTRVASTPPSRGGLWGRRDGHQGAGCWAGMRGVCATRRYQ